MPASHSTGAISAVAQYEPAGQSRYTERHVRDVEHATSSFSVQTHEVPAGALLVYMLNSPDAAHSRDLSSSLAAALASASKFS